MINFKKMDEQDFVFVNKPVSASEEKEFSEFLKSRKAKRSRKTITKKVKEMQPQ